MKYHFPIDVEACNLEIKPSFSCGYVNVQADIEISDVDDFLDNFDQSAIISYLECQDMIVVENNDVDDLLTKVDLDKLIEFVESQGFKVTED